MRVIRVGVFSATLRGFFLIWSCVCAFLVLRDSVVWGSQKGGFQKGRLANVPYILGPQNRNKRTFAQTALLENRPEVFPLELLRPRKATSMFST